MAELDRVARSRARPRQERPPPLATSFAAFSGFEAASSPAIEELRDSPAIAQSTAQPAIQT
eukprot:CAMPEP_0171248990 /NCGR_PEP_ID=MMETSP0790-20130122/49309_1 /TAXON_ID=2925 /ORGANISM="Alexandrium catenella, Strain OF101" /LENGTH=60 /DNA_ID=CAMNT_0011716475 /DNA_START=10 /DNA_END=189 /DNA_ORIENTATION=-